jgi:hypothetical protein
VLRNQIADGIRLERGLACRKTVLGEHIEIHCVTILRPKIRCMKLGQRL